MSQSLDFAVKNASFWSAYRTYLWCKERQCDARMRVIWWPVDTAVAWRSAYAKAATLVGASWHVTWYKFGSLLKMSAVAVVQYLTMGVWNSPYRASPLSAYAIYIHMIKWGDIVRDLDCSRAYERTNKIGTALWPNTKADDIKWRQRKFDHA
jgi:hypothetical protein